MRGSRERVSAQLYRPARLPDAQTCVEMAQRLGVVLLDGTSTPKTVMHPADQQPRSLFAIRAPGERLTDERAGLFGMAVLGMASRNQERKLGALGVMFEALWGNAGQALPVAELPLSAGVVEEVSVIGDDLDEEHGILCAVVRGSRHRQPLAGGHVNLLCQSRQACWHLSLRAFAPLIFGALRCFTADFQERFGIHSGVCGDWADSRDRSLHIRC